MKQFKKILVVYNGSEREQDTLRRAYHLARRNKARLTIIDVIEQIPQKIGYYFEKVSVSEFESIEAEQRAEEIIGMLKGLERRKKIKADVKVFIGKPHIEIIKEVLRNKHDLLIKTAKGADGARRVLFGGIDISLLRKCPCPVWMVKPSKSRTYSRILAAVDPDPFNEQSTKLNDLIMELALAVSKIEKSELQIIHVWSMFGERTLRGPRFRKTESQMRKLMRDAKNVHKEWLDKLLGKIRFGRKKPKIHLIKGDPSMVIPRVAKSQKIDLIVMGTVCRTGLPGLIIGNTAESILNQVNCSVLTVKPKGFVTPVTL